MTMLYGPAFRSIKGIAVAIHTCARRIASSRECGVGCLGGLFDTAGPGRKFAGRLSAAGAACIPARHETATPPSTTGCKPLKRIMTARLVQGIFQRRATRSRWPNSTGIGASCIARAVCKPRTCGTRTSVASIVQRNRHCSRIFRCDTSSALQNCKEITLNDRGGLASRCSFRPCGLMGRPSCPPPISPCTSKRHHPGLPICTDGGRIHTCGLLGPIKPGDARRDIRVDIDPVYRFGQRFS